MADNELKKLDRAELLELLIAVSKENEQLRSQIKERDKLLEDKTIAIREAGSIAEAALQLNGVFTAAQDAAAQYLENIARCEQESRSLIDDAKAKAAEIIVAAEQKAMQIANEGKSKNSRKGKRR